MQIRQNVLSHNCFNFLKKVEIVISNFEGTIEIDLINERYAIRKDTTIYDRLYIIGRCWIFTKAKIKKDNKDFENTFIEHSEIQRANILGATESIVNILKDKNKSNNVKFFEIKMISSVINKNKKY